MHSGSVISVLHKNLESIFKKQTVLLGGSHLYGYSTAQSDLDFYIITTFPWPIFWHRKHYAKLVNNLKTELNTPNLKILIVPKLLYRLGWYYIYGQDSRGQIHSSPINQTLIFRASLKLAYFHYLGSLRNVPDSECWHALGKAAQQLAAAIVILSNSPLDQPIFSTSNLIKGLNKLDSTRYKMLTEILTARQADQMPTEVQLAAWNRGVKELISQTHNQGTSLLGFNFANYLIYNLRFLLIGNPEFLLTNPDQVIVDEARAALAHSEMIETAYQHLQKIVFPALIL